MGKTILISLFYLIFLYSGTYAQFPSIMIGGRVYIYDDGRKDELDYSYFNYKPYRNIDIEPYVYYTLGNEIMIGAGVLAGKSISHVVHNHRNGKDVPSKLTDSFIGLGFSGRYYLWHYERIHLFFDLSAAARNVRHKKKYDTPQPVVVNIPSLNEYDYRSWNIQSGSKVGINYFLNDRIGLELNMGMAGYNFSWEKNMENKRVQKILNLGIDIASFVNMSYVSIYYKIK